MLMASVHPSRARAFVIHPRAFIQEYVEPSTELYRTNRPVTHLAVHALTQMDVLAEVVALWTLSGGTGHCVSKDEVTRFRNDLGRRESILAVVRDGHDSHKHGNLGRKTAINASRGQRPEPKTKFGFFVGRTPVGGRLTRFEVLVLKLDDGTEMEIFDLLRKARLAWERELGRLGL